MSNEKRIEWKTTRDVKVPVSECLIVEMDPPDHDGSTLRDATPDDLRRACEAVGMVVRSKGEDVAAENAAFRAGAEDAIRDQRIDLRDARERIETLEFARDNALQQITCLESTRDHWKARADSVETRAASTVSDLRARLAALTAPVEGEPSQADMDRICDIEQHPMQADDLFLYCQRLSAWRAGVAHERARHEGTMPRATIHDLFYAWDVARGKPENGLNPVDRELAGLLAVATRVRAERPACLVERLVGASGEDAVEDVRFYRDGDTWRVLVALVDSSAKLRSSVPASDVPATLERLAFGEGGGE